MWLIKVFGAICFTAVCAAQDLKNEHPVLSLKSTWREVFPSEKVEFTCAINANYNLTISWYRDDEQIQETEDKSELTLTAEKKISGNYTCKGVDKITSESSLTSNQIEVIVYDSPTPAIMNSSNDKIFPGETEIQASTSNTYTIASVNPSNSGEYSCKARRGKGEVFHTNEAVTSLQISDPPTPTLKRLSQWSDVFENETVKFSCNVDSPGWTFTWYRNTEKLQEDMSSDGSSYIITSVTRTHEGFYTCKAHLKSRNVISAFSNKAEIKVFKTKPTPTLMRNYGFDVMYVGEIVNFTCTVDVASDWKYKWFKDKNSTPFTDSTSSTISIKLNLADGGKYSCTAVRGVTTRTDSSKEITQTVLAIPVPSLNKSTQWLDVFPSESVKLTCGITVGSDWTYTWQKDDQKVQADGTVSFELNGATLAIGSASDKHQGRYKCSGHIRGRDVRSQLSSELYISVYGEKPSVILTQDPEYNTMFLRESVIFKCHINVSSGWEYQWFKDMTLLKVPLNMYKLDPVQLLDSGLYSCRAKRGSDQVFETDFSQSKQLVIKEKPKLTLTRKPDTDKLYNGESMHFECKVDIASDWNYKWYKDGKIHGHDSRLDIHNVTATANGIYKCMATRNKTKYSTDFSPNQTIYVSDIPVPSLKRSSDWLDVFPTETAKLSCGMLSVRSDWTYTWYRDGKEVHADDTVSFDSDKTTLSINNASASHRGSYSCRGTFKSRPVRSNLSTKVRLHVYDTKPILRLTQTPEYTLMHTEDSVLFTCHNNVSSGWKYVWYKDSVKLAQSGNEYNISSVVTTSSGLYTCQIKRGKDKVFQSDTSEALRLNVEERPKAEITLLTGWSEVFSTDTLLLRCEVKNNLDTWNYTWFKEEQPTNEHREYREKYPVTPKNNPEQSLYRCKGSRNERPHYSKRSDPFKTKNLLLKRRVLLSISGCIFFGIIAVFIGCIVLRVCRKPADDEDKLDEANLFPTMAQLKSYSDAPCPLVDYVTEEKLNAPPKEEDESSTNCNETTPLPITTQDDQAVTSENNDKEETNGGLVSFKQ
ncbi:hypothetical protein Q5P01_007713 [Channa striata]|uniref:Ig-like domain-containing protein n=1 Tax=Channa striata TaxID=64152 RepID=A0AA88N7A3_CHASR|nr:hypothetical protein Q5P01_007713 [Channa striata]